MTDKNSLFGRLRIAAVRSGTAGTVPPYQVGEINDFRAFLVWVFSTRADVQNRKPNLLTKEVFHAQDIAPHGSRHPVTGLD
jgi:hypothetical protein